MKSRESWKLQGGVLIERKALDAVRRTLRRDEAVGRLGKREAPERVLDRDLLGRDRTQEHLLRRVGDRFTHRVGELFGLGDEPKEGRSIEQELQGRFPSNEATRSSGSGSKKDGGTRSLPVASPAGRRSLRGRLTGRSSATGSFRRQSRKTSPRSTRSR
jgi:hypothetical protein